MPARPKSSLSTAVTEGPSLVGVLTLYSTHAAAFTEEHQRILQAVATQVGGPLRDAYQRLRGLRSGSGAGSAKASIPRTSDRLDERRPAAMILAKLVSRRSSDDAPEEISVRTARDVLLMCIRNGDEVFEVPDGLAAILPNADHSTADLICGRMKDLLASRDPNFQLQTVVVTAPQDGLTLSALLESARLRISQARANRFGPLISPQMNIAAATLFDDISSLSRVGRFQDALSRLESDRPRVASSQRGTVSYVVG